MSYAIHPSEAHDRRPDEIHILEVRSLTTADLALLRQATQPISLKRYRDRHHHMAWLVALGKPNHEICAECRISPTRLSQHINSPAFQELINRYRREIESARLAAAAEFGATAGRGMAIAEAELVKRIESTPDDLSFRDLNRYAVDRMDRFGYGKHTTSESRNINVNFAANLEAAIARSRKAIDV